MLYNCYTNIFIRKNINRVDVKSARINTKMIIITIIVVKKQSLDFALSIAISMKLSEATLPINTWLERSEGKPLCNKKSITGVVT
jgi:hypothetical protein